MALLFEPYTLRGVRFRNRLVMSPMCQYSSGDGFVNDWHLVHLGSRAVGGAGAVVVEATAVSPQGRITLQDLGIWKDAHIEGLRRISLFLEAHGAVPGIQLAHAGRKASQHVPWTGGQPLAADEGAWTTEAPSAIPFREGTVPPSEMSTEAVAGCVQQFRAAAERALLAGFRLIEIHAAHGYLVNEFLSPLSNYRTDAYGGSFGNRCRFLLEIVAAVRTVWPDEFPLFVRLSATEWVEGGWTVDDSVQLSRLLKAAGVDLVDCSSGGNVPGVKIALHPGYQVPLAEAVRLEAGIPTGAVGLITTAEQCEAILQAGQADLVFLGRELLRDPYFPLHAAKTLGVEVDWPDQYLRAGQK